MTNPFRYFNTAPEIIRLAVMMYARFPQSLRNVEDLLNERGIGIRHETVRFWWNRFGPTEGPRSPETPFPAASPGNAVALVP
jgi:transposase-like protein